ncbi:MAG: hypothetical protein ACQSGP_27990 [Frankia sp.]
MLQIALLLGGPSEERGISLNSARSVADHIADDGVTLREIIYFDRHENAYAISRGLLYSNTPADFDFKLSRAGSPLGRDELLERLQQCDLALPVIHGAFGEDGRLQEILERAGVPYLGSTPQACVGAFDKFDAQRTLTAAGVNAVASRLVSRASPDDEIRRDLSEALTLGGSAVVKPARGGSSIGVTVVADVRAGKAACADLLTSYDRVVIQPRMAGVEFTTIVLDGDARPTALIPVEIELLGRRRDDDILDYRRKYLVSNDSHYHCPPLFSDADVARVRRISEQAFTILGLRDFARIDGWLSPDGDIHISDVNPISGMEQNSFLFIQAAQVGMTHRDILRYLVRRVCRRAGIKDPEDAWREPPPEGRTPVAVLFGGDTAERQVSVLSGTNVWLKLLASDRFEPTPYLLDAGSRGGAGRSDWLDATGDPTTAGGVWRLPYSAALRHSFEEIVQVCNEAADGVIESRRAALAADVVDRLDLEAWQLGAHPVPPERLTLAEFLKDHDLVFNALHGGDGEDGTMAAAFERHGIRYNGSPPEASRICADKYTTGELIAAMAVEQAVGRDGRSETDAPTRSDDHAATGNARGGGGILTARRLLVAMPGSLADVDVPRLWRDAVAACRTNHLIVKPSDDGCSAGVVPLANAEELAHYLGRTLDGASRIDGGTFSLLAPEQIVELPTRCPARILFEELVLTDDIAVVDASWRDGQPGEPARLAWAVERDTGWVEITVGVLGRRGAMRALAPSVTIARKGVLSIEEKFMGGTGVNITPPPAPPLGRAQPTAVERARASVAQVANRIGMAGYGRIDAFMHRETGEIIVIEANALPGLTPATVLYHQGLVEEPPLPPRALLEHILDLAFQP